MRKLSLEKMITSFVFWKKKGRFVLVKKKLRGHLERIQSGEQVPDQPKVMRVMSKMIKKEHYGTTSTPAHPRKVILPAVPVAHIEKKRREKAKE